MSTDETMEITKFQEPGVKLTKKGKPDGRSSSSKVNISKAHKKVKTLVEEEKKLTEAQKIVAKAKAKKKAVVVIKRSLRDEGSIEDDDSEDDSESSDDDDAYIIQKVPKAKTPASPEVPEKVNAPEQLIVDEELAIIKKSLKEMSEENEKLRSNLDKTTKLKKISNLSNRMLLRF